MDRAQFASKRRLTFEINAGGPEVSYFDRHFRRKGKPRHAAASTLSVARTANEG